jgi:hypothetical protein
MRFWEGVDGLERKTKATIPIRKTTPKEMIIFFIYKDYI